MEKFGIKGMKRLKSCHLLIAMLWAAGVFILAIMFLISPNTGDELYMLLKSIYVVDMGLVAPTALLTIAVGIVYGAFSSWGFFKHRWLIVKWIISVLVIVVGTLYFSPQLELALEIADKTRDLALTDPIVNLAMTKGFISVALQALAILLLVPVSVYKPWKKKK